MTLGRVLEHDPLSNFTSGATSNLTFGDLVTIQTRRMQGIVGSPDKVMYCTAMVRGLNSP